MRLQNVGDAFTNTLSVVGGDTTRYISCAFYIDAHDRASESVPHCSRRCNCSCRNLRGGSMVRSPKPSLRIELTRGGSGGPKIDFRGGRVDATEAGPAGVPEPQDTLQSHTAAFARMGFTPTEMIQLVACGHSLGGVQNAAFPTIVPGSTATSDNPDGQAAFDSSVTTYDNRMYVSMRCDRRCPVLTIILLARLTISLAAPTIHWWSERTSPPGRMPGSSRATAMRP
jgi:hypothetical protein